MRRLIGALRTSRTGQSLAQLPNVRNGVTPTSIAWVAPGTTLTATFPQTDKYTDIGFDAQYQYQGDNFWLTLRGSYIHEIKFWMRALQTGFAFNPNNTLNEARAYARSPTATTTALYSPDNTSPLGNARRIVFAATPTSVRTLTGGSPRSPTFRSSAAKHPDGRGSTCALGCNTPGTPNSTVQVWARAPITRSSSMRGSRYSRHSEVWS